MLNVSQLSNVTSHYLENQGVCENRQNTIIHDPHKLLSFQTAYIENLTLIKYSKI